MAEKTTGKPVRSSKSSSAKTRRSTLRKTFLMRRPVSVRDLLGDPAFAPGMFVALAFVVALSMVVVVARRSPMLAPGRVMDETHAVRVEFTNPDLEETRLRRESARRSSPRVYEADSAYFVQLEAELGGLPAVLASAETLESVDEKQRDAFGLTAERFESVLGESSGGESTEAWRRKVSLFLHELRGTPLLSASEYQAWRASPAPSLVLRWEGAAWEPQRKPEPLNVQSDDDKVRSDVRALLLRAAEQHGLYGARADVVVHRLMWADPALDAVRPTHGYDDDESSARQEAAARAVDEVTITSRPGEVLYERGQLLSEAQHTRAVREHQEFVRSRPTWQQGVVVVAVLATMGLIAAALGGYIGLFYRGLLHRPWRLTAIAALLVGALITASWGALTYPRAHWLFVAGPTVFVAMITVIAYDRRLALVVSGLAGLAMCLALGLGLGYFAAVLAGVGVAAWQLDEVRNRNEVVRASLLTGLALGVGVILVGPLYRPLGGSVGGRVIVEMLFDAMYAGVGGFAAGVLALAVLPTVERVFGITTGMTLSELRDPKHPLLRMLQQRAPGTFNHAHTVATLAESAADSIGANGLHVYVGALFHDIGKMNKPEYFVENQHDGINKHINLSPAMSLLVIVGHVKDGIELGREYGLPRSIQHYIESHHGTTLVEYFYDQAVRQADADDATDHPAEIEYRYPGPKPRSKEAAILMLCDAVESATRAMSEPTPARISTLVHAMAGKRLRDGQFDDCEITLRELHTIEKAIAKSLNSIYHGRIAYPSSVEKRTGEADRSAGGHNASDGSASPKPLRGVGGRPA